MTPAQTRDAIVAEMREYADTSDGCQYGTISTRLLRDFADRLAALPVGDGEPVASAVSSADYWQRRGHHVCPDCAGTRVRSYRQADHLGGQYVDVPCSTCTTPPPAAVPAGFAIEKWLEREAWSFLRNVLTQGQAIEMDYRNNKYESYEHLSSRLDEAARERRDQLEAAIAARPDASKPVCKICNGTGWNHGAQPGPGPGYKTVRCECKAARPDAPAGEKGT